MGKKNAWVKSRGETRESKRARVAGSASAVATRIGNFGIELLIIMRDRIMQDNQGSKSNYTMNR